MAGVRGVPTGTVRRVPGTASRPASKRSLSAPTRSTVVARSAITRRAASPRPTMAGTFCVPLRRSRSWPPPRRTGASGTPDRTTRAPAPFGPPNLWPVRLTSPAPRQASVRSIQATACTASVWSTASGAASASSAATDSRSLTTPVSLLASITDTSPIPSTEERTSARAPRSIRPPSSVETTMPPASATGASTAGCSTALHTGRQPVERTTPSTARLSASVPPLVKTTSPGCAPTRAATRSRASSMARRAERATAWEPDGFPGCSASHGNIASTTSGRAGVLAAWSR